MRDEILNHSTAALSVHQYADTQCRAAIFQRTFIGTQMVNYFGSTINLQQIMAVMVYCNFRHLQRAFAATLQCHDESEGAMDGQRALHLRLFGHWSRMLFSVVDNFGDPIESDDEFWVRFGNLKGIAMMDTALDLQSVHSVTNDPLTLVGKGGGTVVVGDGGGSASSSSSSWSSSEDVMAVIGAQRMGSLYFDASLVSEYPFECEVLLGPSQHLEVRSVTVEGHDCRTYFGAMYIMDAFIGHRLGFDFAKYPKYGQYLCDVIAATMQFVEGGHATELGVGQRLCYEYWGNKKQLFWRMRSFVENATISYLRSHFVTEQVVQQEEDDDDNCSIDQWTEVKAFHFVNTAMLFPNMESIEIQELVLSRFLCDALLELVSLLEDPDAEVRCGRKLERVQLCGADDADCRHYIEFMEEDLERYRQHFGQMNWEFDASKSGIWLFTKMTPK